VLLSTTIVESGLDIPTANTLIVHRADMFGLAQLYQLRGRVGRSKQRAYAYFTLPPGGSSRHVAERGSRCCSRSTALGAGFTLASHDLDIRGAGNLLGEEQSGHIREVGLELYQQMLEEAVAAAKAGGEAEADGDWSPQIGVGAAVMLIPEAYVADLGVRLGLYRRLAGLAEQREIDEVAAELVDRFGPLPAEVEHLLKVVRIKQLCRQANVEKVDAGRCRISPDRRQSLRPRRAGTLCLSLRKLPRTIAATCVAQIAVSGQEWPEQARGVTLTRRREFTQGPWRSMPWRP
jgi:transcription-repair coupling factor (superfamily II helicase)